MVYRLIVARDGFRSPRHTATAAVDSTDRFAGANAIRATPITTSTAEPPKKPARSLSCLGCNASADITTACANLDHAVKAIRLRFAAGLRTAINKKMPVIRVGFWAYRMSVTTKGDSTVF